MNERHREHHALLASLGAPSRFRIALCLLEGDRCVGDLAVAIGLSQSCTTRHVQALERSGVVKSRRDGKRVLVALELARSGLAEVLGIAMRAPDESSRVAPPPAAHATRAPRMPSARSARRPRAAIARTPRAMASAQPHAPLSAPAPPPGQDAPPADGLNSGTHATRVEDPPVPNRRLRETLEDFLL